jgi:hypothetical protein
MSDTKKSDTKKSDSETTLAKAPALLSEVRPARVIAADAVLFAPVGDGSVSVEISGSDLKRLTLRALSAEFVRPGVRAAVEAWKASKK